MHKKKRSRTGSPNVVRMWDVYMYRLLKDINVPKKARQIIHQTILRPILIFVSECWTLTKRIEEQITTADNESYQNDTRRQRMGQKEK